MSATQTYDVTIVGGSYAGLSAALALGRSLRKTLIIDSGKPCNSQTPHSQNFLTQDGKPPGEIASAGREQLKTYKTVELVNARAEKAETLGNRVLVTTDTGARYTAKKLILATGIKDQLLPIPGFSQCWGISVIHCPYCHGFEFRSMTTGILANGEAALHYAELVHNLTKDLHILTNGKADFDNHTLINFQEKGISIIEKEIFEIKHTNGHLQEVVFTDHSVLNLNAMYAKVNFTQHSEIPKTLGCNFTEHGYIEVDKFQKTTIPNVFACGDNSSTMRSVANAVSAGNFTGAMVNMELCKEEFGV